MQNKDDIIKTYLFAICDHKHPRADKENLLKIWLLEFDYLDEKEEFLINFMTACRGVINDSSIYRMPSPQDIKNIITRNISKPEESREKPENNPKTGDLFREYCKALGERSSFNSGSEEWEKLNIKCNNLIKKMENLARNKK